MHIETVLKGFGADWSGDYTLHDLRKEFTNIPFASSSVLGWYSTATDTVLVLGNEFTGKYTAYVWNTPNAREMVLQSMGQMFGFINLQTWRR